MTREEALEKLKFECVRQQLMWDNELNEAISMAINALSAIEDIKAEIEREYLSEGHLTDYWGGIDKALEIIDKHTSGKEKND